MDIITTSLEALIQRATNPQNKELDTAAIDAFCVILGRESDGVHIASKLIATHIQSINENQSLQALILLDTCMRRCGQTFHAEVGKFRFLNEMIKLVSPKYLGNTTPKPVREKVLELLYTWTKDYPREVKINEAYQMLKKQGVVKNESKMDYKNYIAKPTGARNTLFEDEETAKLLQELLHSKDPFELQLANRLIKSMVKDDERRVQQTSRRNIELESAHNNIKLLSEMLDSYNPSQTNAEDVELMKELHHTCESFKPTLLRLADQMQDNEDILGDVLTVNDEMSHVFEKYTSKMGLTATFPESCNNSNDNTSLLDFACPAEIAPFTNSQNDQTQTTNSGSNPSQSDMEILNDIFSSIAIPAAPPMTIDSSVPSSKIDVMQPIQIISMKQPVVTPILPFKIQSRASAFQDLKEIGQALLQESLSSGIGKNHSINLTTKVTNSPDVSTPLSEHSTMATSLNRSDNFGQNWAVCSTESMLTSQNQVLCNDENNIHGTIDDMMMTLEIDHEIWESTDDETSNRITSHNSEAEIKPLTDIHVTLEDITPSSRSPITVINNKNSISVILNFAEGSPRSDISVIVVTTISKQAKVLTNYLFQAVISKKCKCRLQQPSGTELPAHSPFLPPSAITQIMLIANPNKVPVSLKFMLSYTMDGETFTEMGEVDSLFNA